MASSKQKEQLVSPIRSFPFLAPPYPGPEVPLPVAVDPLTVPKPAIPYTPGRKFLLQEHIPPPPLGGPYRATRSTLHDHVLQEYSQFDVVKRHPPIEGGGTTDVQVEFEIDKQLAVGEKRGPQVVAGWAELPQGRTYVAAKIFDAVYYRNKNQDARRRGCVGMNRDYYDYTYSSDRGYSRESAALKEFASEFGWKEMPGYYGSFTTVIGTSNEENRPVRVILMEYLDGVLIHNFNMSELSYGEKVSLAIKICDLQSKFLYRGVDLPYHSFDLAQIILCRTGTEGKELRPVYFGYHRSVISCLANRPILSNYLSKPLWPGSYATSSLTRLVGLPKGTEVATWSSDSWESEPEIQLEAEKEYMKADKEWRDFYQKHPEHFGCLGCRKKIYPEDIRKGHCIPIMDYEGDGKQTGSLRAGNVVVLVEKDRSDKSGWWLVRPLGSNQKDTGLQRWVPASYLEEMLGSEDETQSDTESICLLQTDNNLSRDDEDDEDDDEDYEDETRRTMFGRLVDNCKGLVWSIKRIFTRGKGNSASSRRRLACNGSVDSDITVIATDDEKKAVAFSP